MGTRGARAAFGVALALAALALGALLHGARMEQTAGEPLQSSPADVSGLPAAFVPNRGQWDARVRYTAWKDDVAAAFSRDAIRLSRADGPSVSLRFRGASASARLAGEGAKAGRYNFVFGDDPSRWRTDLPGFRSLTYRSLYDGIDVRVSDRGGLAYDVLLAPGADVRRFAVAVEGARGLRLGKNGSLLVRTQLGTLRQAPPIAWDVLPDGGKRPVASAFRLLGDRAYGFTVSGHDPARRLVIDPGIDWATFLGGAGDESIRGLELARDGTNDIVVAGQTASPDFPHTRGNLAPVGWTPYVARLNASGTELVYSTFFGGSFNHSVQDVGLDSQSRPAVVGDTNSLDFPTTAGAYDRTPGNGFQGDYDAYVIKFAADGSGPVFGTYLAGAPNSGLEQAWRVLFDGNDAPIVAGITSSSSFPTTAGAYDRVFSAGVTSQTQDVFISRLSPDGSGLTYSTFFGGDGLENVYDMVLDPQGVLTFGGKVSNFFDQPVRMPTTADAFDRVFDDGGSSPETDAYLVRFKPDGAGAADLRYATFLGGHQFTEAVTGIALDPNDPTSVTVAGWTRSGDFPTTAGAWLRTHFAPVDGTMSFVSRFRFAAGAASSLEWSTFHGAPGGENADDVAVDSQGRPIFVGATGATNPTTTERAFDRVPGVGNYVGVSDGYVARLSADGARNEYMTLLGGGDNDEIAQHVAYIGGNSVVVAGLTNSTDFPVTPGAYDTLYGHDGLPSGASAPGTTTDDAFLARVTLEEQPTADHTPPPAPQLKGPVVGTTMTAHVLSATFDWTDVADASGIERYQLQISPNAEFDQSRSGIRWWEPWTPTSIEVTDFSISETGSYWWRVRALDRAGNLGPWSDVWTFSVNSPTPPDAPTLASPPNNGRFAPGSIVFDWNPAARAKFYEIQVDTTSSFSNANRIWLRAITATRQTISLTTERRYWWRVRASNDSLTDGPWSTVRSLEIKRGSPAAPVPPPDNDPPPSGSAGTAGTLAPFTQGELPLVGGQSGTLTVNINGPAPTGGATVRLESNYPQFVSAPPSVTIPAGQSSANITVTASNRMKLRQVVISASYGAGQDYGVLVTSYAGLNSPDLHGMSIHGAQVSSSTGTAASVSFAGGQTVHGTVAFLQGWPAPPGGAVVKLGSTNPALVQVPDEVVVPAGQTSATFTVTSTAVTEVTRVSVLASRSMTHRIDIELLPPGALSGLSLDPTTVVGGNPSTGTIRLGSPAPAGGVEVALTSHDTRWATVPPSVTVPAGASSTTFTVTTLPNNSGEGQWSIITASAGGISRQQTINVNTPGPATPGSLSGFTLTPSTVVGGQTSTGRVTLAVAAGTGGVRVDIFPRSSLISTPASVTVPAGQTSASFTVTTQPIQGLDQIAWVAVGTTNSSREAALTITQPPPDQPAAALSGLTLSPSSVTGGQASTGTVLLTGPAPAGGFAVALASSNATAATVPGSVTVPAGVSSTTFTVTTTTSTTNRTADITASAGGITRTATLTVNASSPAAPTPAALSLSPATVQGGSTSTGTVTLSATAPAGGVVVSLASGNPAAASVPSSVTVPAGSASTTFTITTSVASTTRTAVITASANGTSRTATLTVNGSGTTGTVNITRAEYKDGRLRVEATSSPSGTMTAYVTSTGQLIGTLSSGRLELNWPSNPGSVTVKSTNGGEATRAVST